MSPRIQIIGHDYTTTPSARAEHLGRGSQPLLPMDAEFSGRWRFAAWTVVLLVSLLFWVAIFKAVL